MTKSILQMQHDVGYAAGLAKGEEWGRQLQMPSWDDGYEAGARRYHAHRCHHWLSFLAGGLMATVAIFGWFQF